MYSAALLLLALSAVPRPFAGPITEANIATRRVRGTDAIGGLGDWALGNGTICAVISGAGHDSDFSRNGGALIDLGHCDRADDQFSLFQPMLNLGRENTPPIVRIHARADESSASVVTLARRHGVLLRTTYTLDLADRTRLLVELRATREARGPRLFVLGNIALHPRASMKVFTLDTSDPSSSPGFAHPANDPSDVRSLLRSFRTTELQLLLGERRIEPGIAYGIQRLSAERIGRNGRRSALPYGVSSGEDYTLQGVFTRGFWFGGSESPGLLQLGQSLLMDLRAGDAIVVQLAVRVGDRADAASITDQIHAAAPRVSGSVDEPQASLHVTDREGSPVSQVYPAADGSFGLRLPAGGYRLVARASGAREVEQRFEVGTDDVRLAPLTLGRPSRALLPASPTPMRVVFVGADGTADPRIGDDLLGYRFGATEARSAAMANYVALGGLADDPAAVVLAPGRYRVFATRGPEFEVTWADIELAPGEDLPLALEPPVRAFETPGWIAADLHVHSAPSWDSALPVDERLRSFLAEGGEVLVATEHNRVFDLRPRIAALGLSGRLAGIVGTEASSTEPSPAAPHTFGHANVFPLEPRPDLPRGGAPAAQGRRLRDLLGELRAAGRDTLVQLNHPRSRDGKDGLRNFLGHLSVHGRAYDPGRPLDAWPNRVLLTADPLSGLRDLDFDAIELMNGPGIDRYRRVRADWLSLLLQGEFRTATASSDSHRLGQIVALPRSYVRLADDRVAGFDATAFVRAIRDGRVTGSTGPFVEACLGPARACTGERFSGSAGRLSVRVRAARWVPVTTLRVFVDGRVVAEEPIGRDQTVELPLEFAADAFVTVEVEGLPGEVYRALAPGQRPLAFTNPIFVDADADGHWRAPGWPAVPPRTLTAPLSVGPDDPFRDRQSR